MEKNKFSIINNTIIELMLIIIVIFIILFLCLINRQETEFAQRETDLEMQVSSIAEQYSQLKEKFNKNSENSNKFLMLSEVVNNYNLQNTDNYELSPELLSNLLDKNMKSKDIKKEKEMFAKMGAAISNCCRRNNMKSIDDIISAADSYNNISLKKKAVQKENDILKACSVKMRDMEKATKEFNMKNNTRYSLSSKMISDLLEDRNKINKLADSFKKACSKDSPLKTIETMISAMECSNNNLKGKIANLQEKCNDKGNGLDHPSCWYDSNGKVEYIYNITIFENNLSVKKTWPEYRNAEAIQIPGVRNILDRKLSINEFKILAQPLLDWSMEQEPECRLFVRVHDMTDSKKSFKDGLFTIEDFFYKYILVDPKPTSVKYTQAINISGKPLN